MDLNVEYRVYSSLFDFEYSMFKSSVISQLNRTLACQVK